MVVSGATLYRQAHPCDSYMVVSQTYTFVIEDSYSIRDMPMDRLADYIGAFARLLGERANVHFDQVAEGSIALVARVDEPAQPRVTERIQALRGGAAPADARSAYTDLDEMLRRDNGYGALSAHDGNVLTFPGKRRTNAAVFGPFRQEGFIDGEVYRIGGKDETKHINIRSGDQDISCLIATADVALRLRHHLWGGPIRFHGTGSWMRHEDGVWELKTFRVSDFEPLSDAKLEDVVLALRNVAAPTFHSRSDPFTDWIAERHVDEGRA